MKILEEHEKFISVLEGDSTEDVLQIIAEHNSKSAGVQTRELLQTMPQKQKLRLCKALRLQATTGIQMLQGTAELTNAEDHHDPDHQGDDLVKAQDTAAQLLREISKLLAMMLSAKSVLDDMQSTAVILHDNALLVAADWPELQDAVASLCTAWWQAGAPGKEALVAQTLPYLLVRALSTNRSADVKRCYVIRNALALLDFEDESIGDLKRLLLRAAFSPIFLRCKEGRRYLAHLFTLEPQLVRELGAIIRNQIPSGRKSVLDAYGEILFRAWRESTAASLLEVENLVQGLMQAAISASTQPMAAALRRVLDGFHREKAAPGVDALLLRLYRPILFRALAAANPAVRRNALSVLLDAFPLQDSDASNEETDELLSKQFAQLGDALGDAAPAMRSAAVTGVCHLLNTFWELIPAAVTAGFLKRIAGELAFDGACVAVRVAAVTGLAVLAQNPLTQPLMKVMLPTLRPLMWDSALAVRIALADMLLAIGSMRNLSFVDVVPLDTLLDALASDSSQVAQRVHRLLLPSYFSGPEEGPACVAALLRQSPEAGRAFCRLLVGSEGTCVPVEHALALVVALRDHLLACAPEAAANGAAARPETAGRKGKRKKKGAAQPQPVDVQAAETPEALEAMLEGLAGLCKGMTQCYAADELGSDQAGRSVLFSGSQLNSLLGMAATPVARSAVLSIAGAFTDSAASGSFQSRCLSQLLTGCSGLPSHAELRSALHGLVGTDDMAALLDHIIAALDGERPPSARRALHNLCMSGDSALQCLDAMLADETLRLALLSSQVVMDLLPVLQSLARKSAHSLQSQIATSFPGSSAPDDAGLDGSLVSDAIADGQPSLAFSSASVYCKTALHLQLTTALVSAATQPHARLHHEHDSAQLMSGMGDAGPSTADGIDNGCADGDSPVHMWRSVGEEAVHDVLADAAKLLSCLQSVGAENLTGELSGGSEQPTRAHKRGRKGKGPPPDAVAGASGRVALLRSATTALLGAAALAADAARLLRWGSAGEGAAIAAGDLVQWTCELAAIAEEGSEPDWTPAAAAALGHAAKLAHHMLAGRRQDSTAATAAAPESALRLATVLMQAGAGSSDSWRTAALRPFLTGIVAGLCRQSPTPGDCSWVVPLAAAVGEEALDGSAAGDAAHDKTTKGTNEKSTRPSASSNANAENVPQNAQAPGADQMAAFRPSHPFLKAVLQAVNFSKVQPEMALCAARTATLQEAGAWQTCLGAVQLTCLAGFEGAARKSHRKEFTEVASILKGVHKTLRTDQTNLQQDGAKAKECLQTLLDSLVPVE